MAVVVWDAGVGTTARHSHMQRFGVKSYDWNMGVFAVQSMMLMQAVKRVRTTRKSTLGRSNRRSDSNIRLTFSICALLQPALVRSRWCCPAHSVQSIMPAVRLAPAPRAEDKVRTTLLYDDRFCCDSSRQRLHCSPQRSARVSLHPKKPHDVGMLHRSAGTDVPLEA